MAVREKGLLPHSRSFDEPPKIEEERRLCYVGMTRAETRLFLTSAARRRIYGVEQNHTPSLFLVDIPSVCIQDYSAQPVLTTARQPWATITPEAAPAQPVTASAAVPRAAASAPAPP